MLRTFLHNIYESAAFNDFEDAHYVDLLARREHIIRLLHLKEKADDYAERKHASG